MPPTMSVIGVSSPQFVEEACEASFRGPSAPGVPGLDGGRPKIELFLTEPGRPDELPGTMIEDFRAGDCGTAASDDDD